KSQAFPIQSWELQHDPLGHIAVRKGEGVGARRGGRNVVWKRAGPYRSNRSCTRAWRCPVTYQKPLRVAMSAGYDHTLDLEQGGTSIRGVETTQWNRINLRSILAARDQWDI